MKRVLDHQHGEHFHVDGACLYCEEAGSADAPDLLLLHGGFGTMEDFNPLVAALAQNFHIHALDMRGHGRSTLGHERLSYARLAQDVAQFLAYRHVTAPAVIGLQDGGVVAYRLAAQPDQGIARAVAVGAVWDVTHRADTHAELASTTGASWRARYPNTYHTYQRLNPEPDFDGLAEVLVGMWLDDSPGGYPGHSVDQIRCPLLVVRGDVDRHLPRHAAVGLADRVAGAQLLNIPLAGSAVLEETPEVAVSCIRRFLTQA